MTGRGRWALFAGLFIGAMFACDDPAAFLDLPEYQPRLVVFGVLDPDSEGVPIWIGDSGYAQRELDNVITEVWTGGERIAVVKGEERLGASIDPNDDCTSRYERATTLSNAICALIPLKPEHGRTYRFVISADGHETVEAMTRVPGPFVIESATAAGDPPGTEGLRASWSASDFASHYFVAMRSRKQQQCLHGHGCVGGWYDSTEGTSLTTTIDPRDMEPDLGFWVMDVLALDPALHDYLTSSVGGDFFSVEPLSNVDGGYGVIGSWVRRSAVPSS